MPEALVCGRGGERGEPLAAESLQQTLNEQITRIIPQLDKAMI